MSNLKTTKSDSVDDFIRLAQKGIRIEEKPEGLNPSIHCSVSRGIANPKKPLDFKPEFAVE